MQPKIESGEFMRSAEWRGKPKATTYGEARQVFELAKLSTRDSFVDLGCGYGRVCMWAARHCNYTIGIESHPSRARNARKSLQRKRLKNVLIISARFENVGLPSKNLVLYCTSAIGVEDFEGWNRQSRLNVRIVTLGPPPIPIKPVKCKGSFYLTKFPYSTAKTGDEWCQVVLGKRNGTLNEVIARLGRGLNASALRDYERSFKKHFS